MWVILVCGYDFEVANHVSGNGHTMVHPLRSLGRVT